MDVDIPRQDEVCYLNDKDLVYLYGGRWNRDKSCYSFEQLDVEAYIKVQVGQWRLT